MAKRWRITCHDGETSIDTMIFGNVGHNQVQEILVRLQARHMSINEIIEATLAKPDGLSPVKTVQGSDFTTRGRPYYTADHEDAQRRADPMPGLPERETSVWYAALVRPPSASPHYARLVKSLQACS